MAAWLCKLRPIGPHAAVLSRVTGTLVEIIKDPKQTTARQQALRTAAQVCVSRDFLIVEPFIFDFKKVVQHTTGLTVGMCTDISLPLPLSLCHMVLQAT